MTVFESRSEIDPDIGQRTLVACKSNENIGLLILNDRCVADGDSVVLGDGYDLVAFALKRDRGFETVPVALFPTAPALKIFARNDEFVVGIFA